MILTGSVHLSYFFVWIHSQKYTQDLQASHSRCVGTLLPTQKKWPKPFVFVVPERGILILTGSVHLSYFFVWIHSQKYTQDLQASHSRCVGTLLPTQKNGRSHLFLLCRREDLNLQPLRESILSRSRIPIPPLRQSRNILRIFLCLDILPENRIKAILKKR